MAVRVANVARENALSFAGTQINNCAYKFNK
jgi:hypothetical protein